MSKESFFLSSPRVPNMRTTFSVKMPFRCINEGSHGIKYQINYQILAKKHSNWGNANKYLSVNSVKEKPAKKHKLSPVEQAKLYRKLLNSGKVKNRAAIARKFGVSRAWVTKVLSS